MAIKNAREMALIPYANRVTQQRNKREGGGERAVRADGPPPRPTAPPPGGPRAEGDDFDGDVFDGEAFEETSDDVLVEAGDES
jgi:hypothetical protein